MVTHPSSSNYIHPGVIKVKMVSIPQSPTVLILTFIQLVDGDIDILVRYFALVFVNLWKLTIRLQDQYTF